MRRWKPVPSRRGGLRQWLQAKGSLSAHLAATGKFSVQVLDQGRQALGWDEAQALGLDRRCAGYAREVLLCVDGNPMVYARSVTAHAHAVGAWRSIRGLGNRPLANVLFRRLGITRTPLVFAQPVPHSPLQRHVAKAWLAATGVPIPPTAMPARRSVFTRHQAALLVMEIFVADRAHWRWPSVRTGRTSKISKF